MKLSGAAMRETAGSAGGVLVSIGALCWLVLLVLDLNGPGVDMCLALSPVGGKSADNSMAEYARRSGPSLLLMVLAMTVPLLGRSLDQVRARSLAARRARATALFLGGYYMVWIPTIAVISITANAAISQVGGRTLPLFAFVVGLATVWQASLLKCLGLVRCHAPPILPVFGLAAELGALRFGVARGLACLAACAPMMAIPFAAGRGHLYAMVAVCAVSMGERYARPDYRVHRSSIRFLGALLVAFGAVGFARLP